jgi:hypothetical protein
MESLKRRSMVLVVIAMLSGGWLTTISPAAEENAGPDIVSVRSRGQGIDSDSALKDALRRALEKGGRLEIYNESQAENYMLVRDTILARVTGLIHDYKIVDQGEDPIGGYFVEIIAKVDRRLIDATWGQVQILLQQMGRPKILVNFVERICDFVASPNKEQIEADSLLGNKIEQLLVEEGFELVDKQQIEELKKKRLDQATLEQDSNTIRTLAGELGADMYIVGFARASGPQITDAYGVKLFMWETDVTLKAFWSETGQVLFAKNEVGSRSGSRTPGAPGAKKAIEKAGDKLAQECLMAILEKWSRQTVSGGKVILEVNGVSYRAMMAIQDGLKQLETVREVRKEFHKPVAKFEILTPTSAEDFAEMLSGMQWQDFELEIEDQRFNNIRASIHAIEPSARAQSDKPEMNKPESQEPAEQQEELQDQDEVEAPKAQVKKAPAPVEKKAEKKVTTTAPATTKPAKTPSTMPATAPAPVTTKPAPASQPASAPTTTKAPVRELEP